MVMGAGTGAEDGTSTSTVDQWTRSQQDHPQQQRRSHHDLGEHPPRHEAEGEGHHAALLHK